MSRKDAKDGILRALELIVAVLEIAVFVLPLLFKNNKRRKDD